jgi:glycosyltransferase involved in cell wall biosynthesis
MQLVALVKDPGHVCCRYRLSAFRPFLEAAGHELVLKTWPRSWLSHFSWQRHLGDAHAVIVQRKLPPSWQLALLRRASPRLLFDFDDALFLRDSFATKQGPSASRTRGFRAMVRACDAVVAGNAYLQSHAALWASPERIHLVKTCVDVGRYPTAEHVRSGAGAQLAWIGSPSTIRGLERIRPLLEQIGKQVPGIALKIICNRFLKLDQLATIECRWTEATEAVELAAADIGISWLPDDLWSQGKCTLKVLQYMAAGLPVVANPVGMHQELVRHGENGFLAATAHEWVAAIRRLAQDPELRRRMGAIGRRRVQRDFSVSVGGHAWVNLLGKLEHPAVEADAAADRVRYGISINI